MVDTTGENKKISLKEIFKGLQDQMTATLETSRSNIPHSGTKGAVSEDEWLKLFQAYLPRRYTAERAFVIDSTEHISEQQDVVIFDRQYSPFMYRTESAAYIPAESVYAVIEVKQTLCKEHLLAASQKVASVRRLKRTSKKIIHAGGSYSPVEPKRILGGIVALESEWSPPFGKPIEELLKGFDTNQHIDIGCALKNGAFECDSEPNKNIDIVYFPPEVALISFFLGLLSQLQALGTVPAMDIEAYLSTIQKYGES